MKTRAGPMAKMIIIGTVLALLLLAACAREDANAKKEAILKKVLDLQQIKYNDVRVIGSSVEVTYEASNADQYDSQLIAEWGTIFGTLAEFPYDPIAIVNTVNGVPYARITTKRADLHDLMRGAINETQFWERVEIKNVK